MLYSSVIRDRFRHPRFFGDLHAADAVFEDVNPLCGDRVRFQLRLADGGIADARFKGDSCAICMASSDLLAEMIRGRPRGEVLALGPDDLLSRLGATIRPSRMTCVTLPLQVLRGALAHVEAAR
ncbi:MAG: iron-sulfur cluster assembly scaffold protein [Candidatus Rokubacteria bacterium]|nr:iron-sulfur cluster assembly scaffold protein [Candidatus Rokubacteria bacterium]